MWLYLLPSWLFLTWHPFTCYLEPRYGLRIDFFVSNFLGEHAPTRPLDTTCVVCRLWPHHLELPCYSPDFVVNEYCVINCLCPPKMASGLILILLLNLALLLCNALCERSLYEVNCHKCPPPLPLPNYMYTKKRRSLEEYMYTLRKTRSWGPSNFNHSCLHKNP